jgi:hypothetical protein
VILTASAPEQKKNPYDDVVENVQGSNKYFLCLNTKTSFIMNYDDKKQYGDVKCFFVAKVKGCHFANKYWSDIIFPQKM